MTANSSPLTQADVVPPPSPRLAWRLLLGGVAVCAIVGLAGLVVDGMALVSQPAEMTERLNWASGKAGPGSESGSVGELRKLHSEIGKGTPFPTARIGLVGVGVLASAIGLWLRGGADHRAWLAAAAAGWLGGFGLPMHWDSLRMVLMVAGTGAAVGGLLAFLPPRLRFSLIALGVLFHFTGILTATTWPDTHGRSPWLTNQSAMRVYTPYFKFMYLSNAYHFYSPDPGPASQFFILIEYEIDDPDAPGGKRTTAEWVDLPKRRVNYRDPLGLTYYRRLSITELASYSTPGTALPAGWEREMVRMNRQRNEFDASSRTVSVPGATAFGEADLTQYRLPHSPTRRAVYPSYARHIAAEYSGPRQVTGKDGKPGGVLYHRVISLKMFRVEHRIIEAPQFLQYDNPDVLRARERDPTVAAAAPAGGLSPYHPAVYAPYYLGEYAPDGTLKNPNDPLLYWLTPVQYQQNADKSQPDYTDWMSKYAGREFNWGGKE